MAITCGTVGNVAHDPPSRPGWYATLHSWDSNEGMFPGAHFWTGSEWEPETSAGIVYWPILFALEDEARKYAEDHDPDQPKDVKK